MASENIDNPQLNFMEQRLVDAGNYILIDMYLPEDIVIDKTPNKLFERPLGTVKNKNPDKTLSAREIKTKHIITVGFIVAVFAIFFFMMQGGSRKKYNSYKSFKPNEVSEVKSIPINEAMILETYSADDPPVKSGIFGHHNVKVGDKVSYNENENNLVDINGKNRNFNTPLVIVANQHQGSGGRSFGEKLQIPSNTYAYVYLERDVMTGNLSAPLSAVTYIDVKSNGKVVVPKGSRLIGRCRSIKGNRIEMTFDGVIFANGREYSLDGVALGDDNLTGVAGLVDRNITKKTGNLFASSLLDSVSQTMNITGNSFGTIFAGNMADKTSNSLDNAIDESAAASGMTIKIPANTRFKVIFN